MMRYSEIPRDFSSDSLRFTEVAEDQVNSQQLDDSSPNEVSSHSEPALPLLTDTRKDSKHLKGCAKTTNSNETRLRKNSEGATSILSAQCSFDCGDGFYNYGIGSTQTYKTQSLPINASINSLDSLILSALRVTPEDLAGQITLLDFPEFSSIQPDELTSCAWTNKKNKNIVAPNIVSFTKRFNHTSFWTIQEILSGSTPKHRAEILVHFIKVAKKLYELNNLHSLFAIVSAMQTASIFRLSKTWSCISKRDKNTFDRLVDVFNDRNNWQNLREYLESLKLPCIPYLGLFLTDLVYIDLAHPHSGGLESEQRRNKMNNILRMISNYQGSDYSYIMPIQIVQKYLQSIRYIEELQNIFEDDQYKKSLKLEPPTSVASSSSCSSKESIALSSNIDPTASTSSNLSPAKSSGSIRLISTSATKFFPGHRKCRSLGSKFRSTSLPRNFHQKCFCAASAILMTSGDTINFPPHNCKCRIFHKINSQVTPSTSDNIASALPPSRHLLDDSVIEDRNTLEAMSTRSTEGVVIGTENQSVVGGQFHNSVVGFQGCVRRKTLLKDGRKPAVASWQRYWLQIWANSLVYFPPKSFKGNERNDFKREPCKVCSLMGWSAQLQDNNPQQYNTFQLINTAIGTVYKFRTSSAQTTAQWLEALRQDPLIKSQNSIDKQLPINLMSFE